MTLEFPDGKKESHIVSLGRGGRKTATAPVRVTTALRQGRSSSLQNTRRNAFTSFCLLSYPDESAAKQGLQSKLISQSQFDSIQAALNAKRTPPAKHQGWAANIGIHGQPGWVPSFMSSVVRRFNWKAACISVTDAEIDHIYEIVDVGTPVVIK